MGGVQLLPIATSLVPSDIPVCLLLEMIEGVKLQLLSLATTLVFALPPPIDISYHLLHCSGAGGNTVVAHSNHPDFV